jgi:hypothetical protein
MWDFFRQNPFVAGALSGSLAAYLLGLLVTHLRREKKWLGYSKEMRTIVRKGHPHLSIKYDDVVIERLDSHSLVVRNIGNRPLSHLDVHFDCGAGSKILEREVKSPDGSSFGQNLEKNDSSLTVTIDLLNPGESFSVGLTVSDSTVEEVKVVARAENLIVKEVKENIFSTTGILDVLAETSTSAKFVSLLAKSVVRVARL